MTSFQISQLVMMFGGGLWGFAASEWRYRWLCHLGVKDAAYTSHFILLHPEHWPSLAIGETATEARLMKKNFFSERPVLRTWYWAGIVLFWLGASTLILTRFL
jgi:hypothetical protein